MTRRAHIPLKTKLAAALCQMVRFDESGKPERIISHDQAKTMTADQIVSAFHFDHFPIPKAHDGPDEAWNLVPLPVAEHREKTAKVDIPQIAKTKRLSKREEEFRRALLAKSGQAEQQETTEGKPSRFPCSRDSRWKRRMDGTVVERTK